MHSFSSFWPSPGVKVWSVIGCTSRSPLVRIDDTMNSARYISGVLRPVALNFIRTLQNLMFQQDLSPIENVWSMVAEIRARYHTPVTLVDELWHRVEAAWASISVHAIQSLFDSMPRRISAVIIARGGCSEC
ncbi:odorant receptor [Trichonephila clavipes]|nr:odorant receptor [Trichonephila clavipes]